MSLAATWKPLSDEMSYRSPSKRSHFKFFIQYHFLIFLSEVKTLIPFDGKVVSQTINVPSDGTMEKLEHVEVL